MSKRGSGLSLKFTTKGIDNFTRRLDGAAKRQVPFAAKNAINSSLFKTMTTERKEIEHVFKAPKAFTIKSQKIKKATKSKPSGIIWIKDRGDITTGTPPGIYLTRQVKGTTRPEKAFTRALIRAGLLPHGLYVVPAKAARLDKFGNITPGMHQKILAALKAKDGAYFIPRPDHPTLPLGVYKRMAKRRVKAVFIFVKTKPRYKARFDFAGVAIKTFKENFNRDFVAALHHALKTAR